MTYEALFLRTVLIVYMALFTSPSSAAGQCNPTDFSLENMKVEVKSKCDNNGCPRLVFAGNLRNNCESPSSAKLRFIVFDKNESPIEIIESWTSAPQNLAPGDTFPFIYKTGEKYSPAMASYRYEIVETKTW